MIEFRQKEFSEYDAIRSLYVELMKYGDRNKYKIINSSALIPVLKGNNVVIERFVISTSFGRKDRYRMYLKIGAKAKMPDEVRLPGNVYDKKLGNLSLTFRGSFGGGDNNGGNNNQGNQQQRTYSLEQKEFGKNKNNGGGGGKTIETSFTPYIEIHKEVTKLLGDAVKYDKKSRSLVLEFASIQDAIRALNILPFGLDYKIYLLDA